MIYDQEVDDVNFEGKQEQQHARMKLVWRHASSCELFCCLFCGHMILLGTV